MPFIWSPEPNLPAPTPPLLIGPDETSSKVHVVANTVNVGGAVSYNTSNSGYDVVYEVDSLNVRNMRMLTGNIQHANIGTAIINTATINQVTINTANITHATINIGYFTGNTTANFSMVTKQYVDNAIAGISSGSGPDTTANLITTKGDLLVGFAPNTAHRFGVGSDGQALSVALANTLKTRWVDSSSTQSTAGLHIGTHYHPTLKYSQVLLQHVDGIIMNDGEYVTGWDGMVADLAVSGAGGRDSASASAANTWYEVWAIRNSSSGSKALLLHRMLDRSLDQFWLPPTASELVFLRRGEPALTIPAMRYSTRVSQSFVPSVDRPIKGIEIWALKVITIHPNTGGLWMSIQGDNGLGNADGSSLGTSGTLSVHSMIGGSIFCQMHFIFDTAVAVSAGSRYHMVLEGDWPIGPDSNSISMGFYGNTSPLTAGQQVWMANVGYTSGNLTIGSGYGDCRLFNGVTGTWMVSANAAGVGHGPQDLYFRTYVEDHNTSLALPAGYNQKSLISFVCTNGSSNFKEYHQLGRVMTMGYDADWRIHTTSTVIISGLNIVPIHLDAIIPPIPCTLKMIGLNPTDDGTDHMFGLRTMFNMPVDAQTDQSLGPLGNFGFGAGGLKSLLSNSIAIDGNQLINIKVFAIANVSYHVANITF